MKSVSKLKKELDKWFSLYIRLRNAYDGGIATCYTCGKQDDFRRLQCGHFQSRKYLATRWNEQNCQVQCSACNVFRYGEQWKFGEKLDADYGQNTSLDLYNLAKTTVKMSRVEYEQEIMYYKTIVNNLKKELGIM
tara:strand:+ start:1013 stop:1417 length:405 start_codon:yes stop_codon:yes gene_type:complete